MTCKDCIHYGVCRFSYNIEDPIDIFKKGGAEDCDDFRNRKQREGEWIEQIKTTTNAKGMTAHYTINFCSNCGYEIGTIRYRHKYCPNCGAKMKGGAE